MDELDIDKLKNVTSGLSSLKSKVDKSDIGKLETTPVDLSKLSDVIKNDVVKRIEHGELVKKVDNIKTTDTSDLVKKPEYDTKIGKIEKKILDHNHDKYVTTPKFNKLMLDNLAARLNQANLASENDISEFINSSDLDKKIETLASKAELKVEKDKIEKLETYDSSIFISQSYFFNERSQNFLKFLPILNNFTMPNGLTEKILA